MADITNLGRTERRESPINGLSDALGQGLQIGVQRRQVRAQEDQNKNQARLIALKEQESPFKQAQAQSKTNLNTASEKLKSAQEEAVKTKGAEAFIKKLSRIQIKDPQQFQMIVNNEGTKAMLKETEKLIPLPKDQQGNYDFRQFAVEDYKQALDEGKAHIADKLLKNEPLTPGEQQFKEFIGTHPETDLHALAFKGAINASLTPGTPEFNAAYKKGLEMLTSEGTSNNNNNSNSNPQRVVQESLPPELQSLMNSGASVKEKK